MAFGNTLFDGSTDHDGGDCGLSDGSQVGQWRLPNVKELLSLVDHGESSPALPSGHPFVSVLSSFYWSSSSIVTFPSGAWGVNLSDGSDGAPGKANSNLVWPVRGGQ